jgi:hypothetical protein
MRKKVSSEMTTKEHKNVQNSLVTESKELSRSMDMMCQKLHKIP